MRWTDVKKGMLVTSNQNETGFSYEVMKRGRFACVVRVLDEGPHRDQEFKTPAAYLDFVAMPGDWIDDRSRTQIQESDRFRDTTLPMRNRLGELDSMPIRSTAEQAEYERLRKIFLDS